MWMTILNYKNSQRPVLVENMTLNEYKNRQKDGDKLIIRILKHKTAASTGLANIVVDTNYMQIMNRYHHYIRAQLSAQSA